LQLWSAKLRSNQRFQRLQALAKVFACLVAVPVFNPELSFSIWGFVAANLISSVLISSDYDSIEKHDEWLDV
jgi:hypothetical protein